MRFDSFLFLCLHIFVFMSHNLYKKKRINMRNVKNTKKKQIPTVWREFFHVAHSMHILLNKQQQQCLEHFEGQKRDLIKYNNQMREGNVTSCTLHTEESPKFLLSVAFRGISLIFIFVALSPWVNINDIIFLKLDNFSIFFFTSQVKDDDIPLSCHVMSMIYLRPYTQCRMSLSWMNEWMDGEEWEIWKVAANIIFKSSWYKCHYITEQYVDCLLLLLLHHNSRLSLIYFLLFLYSCVTWCGS